MASVSRSLSLSLFKLAESNKARFCQPWVVSLQISAHEETSKTKYPWRDGVGLFLRWPLFHAAIWKCKIRVSATQSTLHSKHKCKSHSCSQVLSSSARAEHSHCNSRGVYGQETLAIYLSSGIAHYSTHLDTVKRNRNTGAN